MILIIGPTNIRNGRGAQSQDARVSTRRFPGYIALKISVQVPTRSCFRQRVIGSGEMIDAHPDVARVGQHPQGQVQERRTFPPIGKRSTRSTSFW